MKESLERAALYAAEILKELRLRQRAEHEGEHQAKEVASEAVGFYYVIDPNRKVHKATPRRRAQAHEVPTMAG